MQAKTFFLAAALIAFPVAGANAQSTPDQSAPNQGSPGRGAPSPSASPAPGADAVAGQSAWPGASSQPGLAVPVTIADVKPGATVYDAMGAKVGTVETVTSAGGVVSTGTARAQIPIASFAKNAQGLVISMSKVQLEAAVAKASAPKS